MPRPILDDGLWALIEPLLPPPKPRRIRHPGRKPLDNRAVLTGILTGCIKYCLGDYAQPTARDPVQSTTSSPKRKASRLR
ncbi:transposase-like protein [Caballeronia arationis]|jgi:hypothetical protein|uniref:Transposase of IS4/5 family n=1 Tax=Caballeronia arationis TaxID=1777142 RepID=A0A7Z7IEJ3_9BURK|nr:transposase-like protein [Caballeronia arationis]SOE89426.1 Putative transposase of IS4/5 family [Caballeronia arationis]